MHLPEGGHDLWYGLDLCRGDSTFYDVRIARGMARNTFFEITEDGNRNSAWNLLRNNPKKCYQWEPNLFFKGMWYHRYRKVMVVPTLNLEYSNEAEQKIKVLEGYVTDLAGSDKEDQRIE
jgi:alpha-1,3-mannosyltransferase